MRVAIAGVPRSGKTTLARTIAKEWKVAIWQTDSLIGLGWSEASEAASLWFDDPGVRIIEGVAIPRALRKWLKRNPEGKPVDKIIYLSKPHVALSKGQRRMAKGCMTVWLEIVPELRRRGIEIQEYGRGNNETLTKCGGGVPLLEILLKDAVNACES